MPPKKEEKKADKKDDKKKDDKKKDEKKDDKKKDDKKGDEKKDEGKGKDKGKKGKGAAKKKDDTEIERAFKPDDEEELFAPAGSKRRARKERYAGKLRKFLHEYKNALICTVDFVGSNQMQQVRSALRGKGEILMGKNTVIRKIVREEAVNNPKLQELLPLIQGNIGFCWTNGSLTDARKIITQNKVPAAAKVGNFAPEDVVIPPGPTGLDPGQTAFFQALNISTKIARGSIEITTKIVLVKKGERVSASHVSLLSKLDLKPFAYGIQVTHAYENGSVYKAEVLDLSQDDLFQKWMRGVRHVAALSLAVGHPTAASLPHSIANAAKKLIAISLEVDYSFPAAQIFKDMLANPDKYKKAAKAEKEEEEEEEAEAEEEEAEEESDGAIGGGLFGDEEGEKKDEGEKEAGKKEGGKKEAEKEEEEEGEEEEAEAEAEEEGGEEEEEE
jgi:large subunit ribosomal protein LP0